MVEIVKNKADKERNPKATSLGNRIGMLFFSGILSFGGLGFLLGGLSLENEFGAGLALAAFGVSTGVLFCGILISLMVVAFEN